MTQVRRNSIFGSDSRGIRQPVSILDQGFIEKKPVSIKELSASINCYPNLKPKYEGNKQRMMNKVKLTSFEKLEKKNIEFKVLLSIKQNLNLTREKLLMSYQNMKTEPNMNYSLGKTFYETQRNRNKNNLGKKKAAAPAPNLKFYFNNINLIKNDRYSNKCDSNNKNKSKKFPALGYVTNPLLKLKLRLDPKL